MYFGIMDFGITADFGISDFGKTVDFGIQRAPSREPEGFQAHRSTRKRSMECPKFIVL